MPLKRQVVWTNHDIALFVAVAFNVGVPNVDSMGSQELLNPFFKELHPRFEKKDIASMIVTLKEKKAIDDLKFLQHLTDGELDRLLPRWAADDVRRKRK